MIRAELSAIARRTGIALVGSSVDRSGDQRYISASFFDAEGSEQTRYRKSHLFGAEEKSVFTPGNDLPELVSCRGVALVLGLCYDIEFPEFARSAAMRGADLLCIPTAVPATGDLGDGGPSLSYNAERISTLLVPSRALENGVYIAYANHTAPGFTGLSCIASPYGTILATAAADDELLVATVDEAEVAKARELNTYLECVRSDLYSPQSFDRNTWRAQ
jgi:predicted amidohydrolase